MLDQSPIRKGSTAIQAVRETIELAKFTEALGYTRYWVAEHHNTGIVAGSSPEVLLANLAAHTSTMRIGSGGVMMPNHSALKVAENFRMLEALAPGRIDLGMGRAPGTDRITASMLNPSNQFREQDFVEQLADLQNYLHDAADVDTIHRSIRAIPQVDTVPQQWLLSSSGQSGLFAAHFGMGFSFAHFINPVGGPQAVKMYRDRFQPSQDLARPAANLAIFVFCSDDTEKVARHKAVMDHRFLQFEKGGPIVPLVYDDVKHMVYTEAEQDRIRYNRQRVVAGSPEMVQARLAQLAENYDVEEIMAATITEDFDDRLRSYELLAGLFELKELSY